MVYGLFYAFLFFAALVLGFSLLARHARMMLARDLQRAAYIRGYEFPQGLFDKLAARRPQLQAEDVALVAGGLRQFFLAYLGSGSRAVSMPSQIVDDLWHEFILYTRDYQHFCEQAFGGFFHHTPAVALAIKQSFSNAGLRRVWSWCCREENIDPRLPLSLPLLFAIDAQLNIPDGFFYSTDCKAIDNQGRQVVYCGGDFSSGEFDGNTDGFGGAGGDGHGHGHDGHASGDGGGHGGHSGCGGDSGGSSCGGGSSH